MVVMCKQITLVLLSLLIAGLPLGAEGVSRSREAVELSSDVLLVAMPVATATTMLVMKDWTGFKQAALTGVTTLGATYLLKFAVHKKRPDGSNNLSFPSGHTSITFANAAFVQRRYGWAWGAPAYAVAAYVGWARTYARRHDWWDVAAGALIGAGSAYIYTRPFARDNKLVISPVSDGNSFGVYASLVF